MEVLPSAVVREALLDVGEKLWAANKPSDSAHTPIVQAAITKSLVSAARYLPLSTDDDATVPLWAHLPPPTTTRIPDFVSDIREHFLDPSFSDDRLMSAVRRSMTWALIEIRDMKASQIPKTPADMYDAYLSGTPFQSLLSVPIPYRLPQKERFEHHHIVAAPGHGKTQTLQYLIARDLEAVAAGEASVIVIDSQGQMIPIISRLKCFAPGQPLHGRLIVVNPREIEHPFALPLFQSKRYADPAEAEQMQNSAVSLLQYVFTALLDAELTTYQATLLGFVIRLCMVIPNATIFTLRDVLEDIGPFRQHVDQLSDTAQRFFETQYDSKHGQYIKTRTEVVQKLYGILEYDAFTRMFSSPRSRFDMFTEMNAGKVILIDARKKHLRTASGMFGRFFIAMVLQATEERTSTKKLPTYFYIDEFQEYLDQNIGTMTEQARKSNVGMILAHQGLYQLGNLSDAVALAAIKFAGGVSPEDAAKLAKAMNTTPEFIRAQPPLTFAAHVRGSPTVPLTIPAGYMENMERMTDEEWDQVRDEMRAKYAARPAEPRSEQAPEPAAPADAAADETAPTKW